LYTGARKNALVSGVKPDIVVIDECHHCASDNDLQGVGTVSERNVTTKTYLAAHQLVSGKFWPDSGSPRLLVLMSATPFRSRDQFANLLRLLLHGVDDKDAYASDASVADLRATLERTKPKTSIVWRRQDDTSVRSWRKERLFPNLRIVRPHRDQDGGPALASPNPDYINIMKDIR